MVRWPIAAALALTCSSWVGAQQTPVIADFSNIVPIAGDWSYLPAGDGSEAWFTSADGHPQLWIHCVRATRHVSIARPAAISSPIINVWTSSEVRAVAAAFNPATSRLTADFANYDTLLDAIAASRGRIAFSISGEPALVVPAWPEVARVIEDCRS